MAEQRTPFTAPTGAAQLDDSFINSMGLQRPRTGPAGVTRAGGVGGAGLTTPATPTVNPPGVAQSPVGRPPSPTPGAPAVPTPAPATPGLAAPTPAPTAPEPATAPTPSAPAAPPAQPTDFMGRVFQQARMAFNKMPSRGELVGIDPSVAIDTPYGQMVTNPDTGQRELVFTPEGKVLWGQETQRLIQAYGPTPVAGLVGAPQPPVEPGRLAYNPFGVGWVR